MKFPIVRSQKPCVKQVSYTLFALLVLMLATEMAEAQMAPSTKPQPAAIVSRPQKALPSVASKGSRSESIDKTKCTDIQNSEKLVREEIIKRVRESVKNGAHPSLAFEKAGTKGTVAARADLRATAQADALAGALFAAVKDPTHAADAASERMTGNPNRRATLDLFVRCTDQPSAARQVAENSTTFIGGSTCGDSGAIKDVGVNSRQVWQTNFSMEKVKVRFARAKVLSSGDNTVRTCEGTRASCVGGGAPYDELSASSFSPVDGHDYFFEDTTQFDSGFLFKVQMMNRTVSRIAPIDVCGAKVYLVSSFNNGNSKGLDNSSLLGLIASVGGKTLVLGDVSAQALTPRNESPDRLKIPLHFPEEDKIETLIKTVLNTGYSSVGDVIGSTERPVLGEIGGFPYVQKGRLDSDSPSRRVSTAQ